MAKEEREQVLSSPGLAGCKPERRGFPRNWMKTDDLKNRFYRYKRDALYPRVPAEPYIPPASKEEWRERYRVRLAWSNPEAGDDILLRKAIASGSWTLILSAARLFGAQALEDVCIDYLSEEGRDVPQWKRDYLDILIRRARHGRFE